MSNFNVKIDYEHGSYYLSTTRNGYQWNSIPIDTPEQMCQIAEALIDQAHKLMPDNCLDCDTKLELLELNIDYEAIENYIAPNYLILWCNSCKQALNGLGKRTDG